jgi:hypothetical protein
MTQPSPCTQNLRKGTSRNLKRQNRESVAAELDLLFPGSVAIVLQSRSTVPILAILHHKLETSCVYDRVLAGPLASFFDELNGGGLRSIAPNLKTASPKLRFQVRSIHIIGLLFMVGY